MGHPVDILAFSPHPDDAELGCGGSLLLAVDRGLRVAIADLTVGERSTRGTPERRREEATEAAGRLGLSARYSLGLPDTLIGCSPEHRDEVVALVREVRPRIVLAPYWEDRHPDHEAASRVVREACFFAGVGGVGTGPPYRPPLVVHYTIHAPVTPSFVVDVSSVWDRKRRVLAAYESQFGASDSSGTALSTPAFMQAMDAKATWFGAMIGATRGEPFVVAGPVRLSGLPGLEQPPPAPGETLRYRSY
jgi:bacillithiol biosynthesis deacetylase BshB1